MYTIGIDLGGTGIKVGLCDEALNILDKESAPTLAQRPAEEIVKDMATLTEKIIKRNNLTLEDIKSVGIATPGTVDIDTGMVIYSNNIPMKNFPMVEVYRSFLPIEKIYIENDANAAALGEALAGSAKGSDTSVMITLGTGVGGGIILGGKIFAGGINHAGGELGHTVINIDGRQCTCGRRGCFEAYCSATALTDMTKEKMHELKLKGIPSLLFDFAERDGRVSARTAFSAKNGGDKYGAELVNEYIKNLAAGITNIINIFQPETVCIGGGVSGEKDNLIIPLAAIVNADQYTRTNNTKTVIKVASLGNNAGIVGAAGLGR